MIKTEEPVDVEVPPVAEAVPPVAETITVMLFPAPASVSNRVDCRLQSRNGPQRSQQLKDKSIFLSCRLYAYLEDSHGIL